MASGRAASTCGAPCTARCATWARSSRCCCCCGRSRGGWKKRRFGAVGQVAAHAGGVGAVRFRLVCAALAVDCCRERGGWRRAGARQLVHLAAGIRHARLRSGRGGIQCLPRGAPRDGRSRRGSAGADAARAQPNWRRCATSSTRTSCSTRCTASSPSCARKRAAPRTRFSCSARCCDTCWTPSAAATTRCFCVTNSPSREQYLALEAHAPRATVCAIDWQVDDELLGVIVPALSVQPLVENSIKPRVQPPQRARHCCAWRSAASAGRTAGRGGR